MSDQHKIEKKRAKARVKEAKARAKAAEGGRRPDLPEGVGISVSRREGGSELTVRGLDEGQIQRLLPHVGREVRIALAADRSPLRAGVMGFIREGVFQTIVKIVAGLIVGYLLIKFGMR